MISAFCAASVFSAVVVDANVALQAGARFVVRFAGDDFFRRTIVGSDQSANDGTGEFSRADETEAVTMVGCL